MPSGIKNLHAKSVFWFQIFHIQTSSGGKDVKNTDFAGRFLALEGIICP